MRDIALRRQINAKKRKGIGCSVALGNGKDSR